MNTIGVFLLSVAAFVLFCAGCKRAPTTEVEHEIESTDYWKEAVTKVEQDRDEPVGNKATVEVPGELKHYSNRHRFLAIQAADARTNVDKIAQDFADLVPLIQRGELVEMQRLGTDYILYGVGYNAGRGPFTHYDESTRQPIPLVATEEELKNEMEHAAEEVKYSAAELAQVEAQLRRVQKRDRARRAALSTQAAAARNVLASAKTKSKLLTASYSSADRRRSLLSEYRTISDLARDFGGESYDLNNPEARRRLKIRLLSYIRPEARDVLLEIARAYREKFDRPLPVSSLVRPVQYQRELAERNPNATRDPMPPHSTGFAFDLYYRYMSAAEQEFLMTMIAGLKDAGRVEVLRETRDNFHVYVFGNGRPPDEKIVARLIKNEESSREVRKRADKKNRSKKPHGKRSLARKRRVRR